MMIIIIITTIIIIIVIIIIITTKILIIIIIGGRISEYGKKLISYYPKINPKKRKNQVVQTFSGTYPGCCPCLVAGPGNSPSPHLGPDGQGH